MKDPLNNSSETQRGANTKAPRNAQSPSDLSAFCLPSQVAPAEQLALETRVHGILKSMATYLNIEIGADCYPTVELVRGWTPEKISHYQPHRNHILINEVDAYDGFTIAEEVTHCLLYQKLDWGGSGPLSGDLTAWEVLNTHEFVGYLGREIARRGCRSGELKELFPSAVYSAPQSYAWVREHFEQSIELAKSWLLLDHVFNAWGLSLSNVWSPVPNSSLQTPPTRGAIPFIRARLTKFCDALEDVSFSSPLTGPFKDTFYAHRENLKAATANVAARLDEMERSLSAGDKDTLISSFEGWRGSIIGVSEALLSIWGLNASKYRRMQSLFIVQKFESHVVGYLAAAAWLEQNGKNVKKVREFFSKDLESTYRGTVEPLMRAKRDRPVCDLPPSAFL